jgi:arylsulfatase A-like enzyme
MSTSPNVVLLITHDTGRYVSPYGIETVDTPNCERLARESVTFDKAFCAAPQCSPSRAALVTGRYPHSNGVMGLTHSDFGWALPETELSAAKLFGPVGYETWLFGLQHETGDGSTLGFDHVDLGFSILDLPEHLGPLLSDRDENAPFFCQIGCFETHRPWNVWDTEPDDSLGVHVPPYLHDGPETRAELASFQGLVKRFDKGLGQLLDLLQGHGLGEHTVLVVTTDHGIAMPMAKATLRDPGIETFLFMRYPDGGWAAGRRERALVSNVDVLPTLLEATGTPLPATIQGRSFLPLLRGDAYDSRDAIFAEKTFHGSYDPMRCIRTERYKYIRYFEKSSVHKVPADISGGGASRELGVAIERQAAEELFDLRTDPNETTNLAADPAHQQTRDDLRARLAQWMIDTDDPLRHGPIASPYYERAIREFFR